MLSGKKKRNCGKIASILMIWMLVWVGLVGLNFAADETSASRATEINWVISSDTTWTTANSPYIIKGNVLVENGVTLTINPGVVVKFDGDYYIQVEGKLIAEGIKDKMITFTTNNTNPTPGKWDSIKIMYNADNGSSIKYCKIEWAKNAIRVSYNNGPDVLPIISNNYLINNENGIVIYSSFNDYELIQFNNKTQITNNIIRNSEEDAIYITIIVHEDHYNYNEELKTNFGILIKDNIIEKNSGGIYYDGEGIETQILNNNIIANQNGIYGDIHSSHDYDGILKIISNIITLNSENGIDLSYGRNNVYLENNTLAYNQNGILIQRCRTYNIQNNNIYNNTDYNVFNEAGTHIDWNLQNNWWGITNSNNIAVGIYDYYDDFNKGIVNYQPILTKPSPSAPKFIYNQPPTANAGPNQNAKTNQTLNFDGSDSSDPDDDPLTYKWDFGDGNSTEWQSSSNTSHSYSKPGEYIITLTVSDGTLTDTDISIVQVTTTISNNQPPVANAGSNMNVKINQSILFNGSGSSVPDGDPFLYKWDFGDGNSTEWQSSSYASHSYSKPGIYTGTLMVSDGEHQVTDTCTITVKDDNADDGKPYYYAIEIEKVTGGTLSLSEVKFKFYDPSGMQLYSMTKFDAEPASIALGDTICYPISSGSHVSENQTTGDGAILDSESLNYPDVWENCYFAYIDSEGDDKINAGDVVWIYKDYNNDGVDEVNYECRFKIVDEKNNEHVNVKFPIGNSKSILVTISLNGDIVDDQDYEDTDTDNMPDYWEDQFDLDPMDPSDAQLDLDNDSLTNLQEYNKGSDPNNWDTDYDGYSDRVDAYPTNEKRHKLDDKQDTIDLNGYIIVLIVIVIILLLIILKMSMIIKKRKSDHPEEGFRSKGSKDKILHDILFNDQKIEKNYSNAQLKTLLDTKFKKGDISQDTYDYILNNVLIPDEPSSFEGNNNGYKVY